MEQKTVIAKLKCTLVFSKAGYSFMQKLQENQGDFDEVTYFSSRSKTWNSAFKVTVQKEVNSYFQGIGLDEKNMPVVRVDKSYSSSWIIEASIIMAGAAVSVYKTLKAVSEIPTILDGLAELKSKIQSKFKNKANKIIASKSKKQERSALDIDFMMDTTPLIKLANLMPLIPNPNFSFIFTINLDGRINMRSILTQIKEDRNEHLVTKHDEPESEEDNGFDLEPLENYFKIKEMFTKQLIPGGCGECDIKGCQTKNLDLCKDRLSYFVDKDFIKKAILGCWELNKSHKIEIKEEKVGLGTPKHIKFIYDNYISNPRAEALLLKVTESDSSNIVFSEIYNYVKIRKNKVSLKLFSNGSISINVQLRLRVENENVKITPVNLIRLIQLPNLVVPQYKGEVLGKDDTSSTGFLNYVAYDIANNVFNSFFKCLEKKKKTISHTISGDEFTKAISEDNFNKLKNSNLLKEKKEKEYYFDDSLITGNYLLKRLKRSGINRKQGKKIEAIWQQNYIDHKISLVDYLEIERVEKRGMHYEPLSKSIFDDFNPNLSKILIEKEIMSEDPTNSHYLYFHETINYKWRLQKELKKIENGDDREFVLAVWRPFHERSEIHFFIREKIFNLIKLLTECKDYNILFLLLKKLKLNEKLEDLKESLERYYKYRIIRNRLKNNRYTMLRRYLDKRYTDPKGNFIYAWPYVGVTFDCPNDLELEGEINPKNPAYIKLAKLLAGIATQTEEFIDNLNDPIDFLKTRSITFGSKDAIIIGRRGFVTFGIRHPHGESAGQQDSDLEHFLENPYKTLVFAIETIMATLKSVNAFNKELEEFVSPKISDLLRQKKFKYKAVKELLDLVSKARALSPCEDYSSNLNIHLRSKIADLGSKRLRKYALDELIHNVQHRLENFGHFLRTAHSDLMIRRGQQIKIALWVIGTTLAILKAL